MSLGNEGGVPAVMNVTPTGTAGYSTGGWGGDWGAWIILFLIFGMFGWGNGGFGGFGGGQGALTRADLCSEFNFNGLENGVRGIQQGICDSTYALNNSINGLGMNMLQGFHGVDNAVCTLGYQTQAGFNALGAQLASCCCETQRQVERGFCDTNYNLATNTTAIIQNAHSDTDRVIAKLDAMEMSRKDETIAALRSQVNSLNLSASQANQNATLMAAMDANKAEILRRTGNDCPIPAYVVPNPNCCYGNPYGVGYGGGNNCGCGCGC